MTHTPWGSSQSSKKIAVGIMEYTTASHGGIHLSAKKNLLVHEAWRSRDGFYEEDCQWAIVACTFPTLFPEHIHQARCTAKNYYPHEYAKVYDVVVQVSESMILQEEADIALHKEDWIGISAFGDWHPNVPKGKVGVVAVKGGRGLRTAYIEGKEERWYLISAARYDDHTLRCRLGYIVQDGDEQVSPFNTSSSKRVA